MKEIPLTTDKAAIVDDDLYDSLKSHYWTLNNSGYAINNQRQFMHHMVQDVPKGFMCDHINGNKLDNRKSNLRVVTRSQNAHNCCVYKSSTLGYKGVRLRKNRILDKPYNARIQVNGKRIDLGHYKTVEEAALAYNKAALAYVGEYAILNQVEVT